MHGFKQRREEKDFRGTTTWRMFNWLWRYMYKNLSLWGGLWDMGRVIRVLKFILEDKLLILACAYCMSFDTSTFHMHQTRFTGLIFQFITDKFPHQNNIQAKFKWWCIYINELHMIVVIYKTLLKEFGSQIGLWFNQEELGN